MELSNLHIIWRKKAKSTTKANEQEWLEVGGFHPLFTQNTCNDFLSIYYKRNNTNMKSPKNKKMTYTHPLCLFIFFCYNFQVFWSKFSMYVHCGLGYKPLDVQEVQVNNKLITFVVWITFIYWSKKQKCVYCII